MLRWLIAIVLNHPFIWEKENENGKSYLPFVFAVFHTQPFGAAVVAQRSIQTFYVIATKKFQANLFPPNSNAKCLRGPQTTTGEPFLHVSFWFSAHNSSYTPFLHGVVLPFSFLCPVFPSPAATTAEKVCMCHSLMCDLLSPS